MLSANAKVKIQSFGRFLSNMVMPNIRPRCFVKFKTMGF